MRSTPQTILLRQLCVFFLGACAALASAQQKPWLFPAPKVVDPNLVAPEQSWPVIRLKADKVLRFDKPSDVLATWRRWQAWSVPPIIPADRGAQSHELRNLTFLCAEGQPRDACQTFDKVTVDEDFGNEALAFIALGACLPAAVWSVRGVSPAVWALEYQAQWAPERAQWAADRATSIGICVLDQGALTPLRSTSGPGAAVGYRAALTLRRKLSDYLVKYRCSGEGPDDCLVLLDALISLEPRDTRLPEVLQAVGTAFPAAQTPTIPVTLAANRGRLTPQEALAVQALRRRLMAEAIYLTGRLRVLAARAKEPIMPGEPAATLNRLVPLASTLLELDQFQGYGQSLPRISDRQEFANPARALYQGIAASPAWDAILASVGDVVARRDAIMASTPEACGQLTSTGSDFRLPPSYWLGYWISSLEIGEQGCPSRAETGWADAYAAAKSPDDPVLQGFVPLRKYLGDESRAYAHLAIVQPLADKCPLPSDPWSICSWAGTPQSRRWQQLSRLPLRSEHRFRSTVLPPPSQTEGASAANFVEAVQRLRALEGGRLDHDVVEVLRRTVGESPPPITVERWAHSGSRVRAVRFLTYLTDGPGWIITYGRGLPAKMVKLPGGFAQYDDGALAALSDMDGDGHLEAWFSGVWGECDGEGSVPGVDCSLVQYTFGGEVFGDRLGYYIAGPRPTEPSSQR